MPEWIVKAETIGDLVDGCYTIVKKFIRCRDCIHRGTENCLEYYTGEGGFHYDVTRDDDYCLFGMDAPNIPAEIINEVLGDDEQ